MTRASPLIFKVDSSTATPHGDGSPITEAELALIRRAFVDCSFETPWHSGDLMIVGNLLVSHGRRPYTGQRRVLVTMAGAVEIGGVDDHR